MPTQCFGFGQCRFCRPRNFVGTCRKPALILAQAAVYVACAPKSNARIWDTHCDVKRKSFNSGPTIFKGYVMSSPLGTAKIISRFMIIDSFEQDTSHKPI